MDKTKMMKFGLSALGMLMTIGATLINDKVKEREMEETIEEKVREALDNQDNQDSQAEES